MPKVSVFNNVKDVVNPEDIELIQYLEDTRDGRWEDIVNKCRVIKDKSQRDAFKRTMPTTTLSGTFSVRSDAGISCHSGFIAMDLDHVENIDYIKQTLESDKYLYSVFVSTSGTGLRALFKIDEKKHRESFIGISSYLFEKYEIVCDPNGINPSKPYIVSFDPYLFLNPDYDNVPVFKKYVKETVIKPISDFVHTPSDFDMVLKQITGRGVNICEDYNDWLKLGFAISEQFGENGRSYFHDISRQSSKYKHSVADKQYTQCIKAKGSRVANISTFYYLAKINNVNIASDQTKLIIRTTRNGKKAGLSKEKIIENLEKFSNITNSSKLVDNVFDSESNNRDDEEESVLFQLEMFISNNYNLKMNEVTGYLEQNGKQLSPADLNTIFISAKKLMPKLDYQLMIRLLKSDFIETYNPFYKFFGSDGIAVELPAIPVPNLNKFESPIIDLLAQSIENDNPSFTSFFLRKWIVGIVSSAHKVHSPLLLCLLGAQNSGKTEFFRRLFPPELKPYYAESKLDKEKDDELLMTENLLIMDDELGGKSKQDSLKLKNITSKQYFSLRRPYGDHNEKILRLAVLCGTSNYSEILSDPTGNRRIIPVEVIDINKELYNSIDKKDLFIEAFKLYKEGFDWRITKEDIPFLNKDQAKYEQIIKERELISKYFAVGNDIRLSTTEMLVEVEILTRQKLNINVFGREVERLGFEKKTTRIGLLTPKKWCCVRINRVDNTFTNGDWKSKAKPQENDEDDPIDDLPF